MAAPTPPTLTDIVTEGLKKAGNTTPTSAQITRASTYWMEEIKNDIWIRAKRLKSLHVTAHGMLTKGKSRNALPDDYSSELSLTLLDGTATGIAQAATASTITLAAGTDLQADSVIGKEILITSCTGVGSLSQAVSYDNTTKISGVVPDLTTTPDATSGYMIVSDYNLLRGPLMIGNLDRLSNPTTLGRPSAFSMMGDEDSGEFILDCAPSKIYGARLRYYANLMKLDLAGTLMATLYQNWREVFLSGLKWKGLEDDDDNRQIEVRNEYRRVLRNLVAQETYGHDMSNLQIAVVDY